MRNIEKWTKAGRGKLPEQKEMTAAELRALRDTFGSNTFDLIVEAYYFGVAVAYSALNK